MGRLRDLYVSRAGMEGMRLIWMEEFLEVVGCGSDERCLCQ